MRLLRLGFVLTAALLIFHCNAMAEVEDNEDLKGPFDLEVTELETDLSATIPEALLEKAPGTQDLVPSVWTADETDQAPQAPKALAPAKPAEANESLQISIQDQAGDHPAVTEKAPEEDVESTVRIVRIAPKPEVEKTIERETKESNPQDLKIVLAKDVPEKEPRKAHRSSRRPASATKPERK